MRLAVFALVVALAFPAAAAAADEEPMTPAAQELARMLDAGSRAASAGLQGDVAFVSIERANRTGQDAVRFSADFQNGRVLLLEANQTASRPAGIDARFTDVVVFEDVDGDGAYDPVVDATLEARPVDALEWDAAPLSEAPHAPGHVSTATTTLGNGTLRLNATLTGSYAVDDAPDLDVHAFAVGIAVDEAAPTWNNATLALFAVGSQRGETAGIPVAEAFPWPTEASVEGAPTPVHVEVLAEDAADAPDGVRRESVQLLVPLEGVGVDAAWAYCALYFECA